MTNFLPDQSFYPSPQMAMQAIPEKLAYVALLNPNPGLPDAMAVVDLDPPRKITGSSSTNLTCRMLGTSCTTSAGTLAVPVSAPTRRIPTWSGGSWWFRECVLRAFIFSTRIPTRESQSWSR